MTELALEINQQEHFTSLKLTAPSFFSGDFVHDDPDAGAISAIFEITLQDFPHKSTVNFRYARTNFNLSTANNSRIKACDNLSSFKRKKICGV